MRDRRSATQASKKANVAANLLSLTIPMTPLANRQTTCNTDTGAWVFIQSTLLNGIFLLKDE